MSEELEEPKIKIGYKGFDKDLRCRGYQFEIGKVHELPYKETITPCTGDGFHYCNSLTDVYSYYQANGHNRFCKIEIIGNFKDEGNKSSSNSIRIIEELTQGIYEEKVESKMKLPVLRSIQKDYPMFHVGGSVALFLHGIRLKRWNSSGVSDIDLISPYFVLVEGDGDEIEVKQLDGKGSANDFDETFLYCFDGESTKVDYRIDPKQRYEIIEHKGFKYKVSPLEIIMAAKFKYALNGQSKHKNDVYEICGKKINQQ